MWKGVFSMSKFEAYLDQPERPRCHRCDLLVIDDLIGLSMQQQQQQLQLQLQQLQLQLIVFLDINHELYNP